MSFYAKDFDCNKCGYGHHCDWAGSFTPYPVPDGWAGSQGPAEDGDHFGIDGVIESDTCLLPMITKQSHDFLYLYSLFKDRVFPYGPALFEHSVAYIEAMEIIEARYQLCQSQQQNTK